MFAENKKGKKMPNGDKNGNGDKFLKRILVAVTIIGVCLTIIFTLSSPLRSASAEHGRSIGILKEDQSATNAKLVFIILGLADAKEERKAIKLALDEIEKRLPR